MCLGVPGQILDVDDSPLRMGRVAFGSAIKEVSLACVPEAGPGAWVVVHAGLALDELDEAEAQAMIQSLAELDADGEGA
ncbi:MAG: HypC/HybG/HupF family hydrogenase formation chaperone [Geothrix sp.]|nr:HypC/HybG/HupF family hydrogenase formation chaperone [Geothrix sp.]